MTRSRITRRALGAAGLVVLAGALLVALSGCSLLGRGSSVASKGGYTASVDLSALGTDQPVPVNIVKMPVAGKVAPPASGAYLGVYVPPAPFDLPPLASYETSAGKAVSIVMWYQPWAVANRSKFDPAACLAVMRRGAVPMITWEPWDPGSNANNLNNPALQPDFTLNQINAGKYDAYIKGWADQIRDLGGPIMLRPMHEMNGNWYPWSGTANGNHPAEYIAAWRHVHDIFAREGATNVTWVWSVNHESTPPGSANSIAAYYPGDAYVDWTAISGFNWGTSLPTTTWRSYSYWYTPPIATLKAFKKPICIAEFASVEQGGDKAAWITDAYTRIAQTPEVKAVIYFDSLEVGPQYAQDWRIETTPASLAAFKGAISSGYFVGGPPEALVSWANSLTTDEWRYLATLQPVY